MHAGLTAFRGADDAFAANTVNPSLVFHYDHVARIIRVTGSGPWTVDYIDQHFAALESLIARVRAEHGEILALVDLSQIPAQTANVAEHIHDAVTRLYDAGDRVALIVQSSLLKAQMKRFAWSDYTTIFISPFAAKTWLCAHR